MWIRLILYVRIVHWFFVKCEVSVWEDGMEFSKPFTKLIESIVNVQT